MEDPIKKHYDDHKILMISFNKDLKNWMNELDFIEKELKSLKNILHNSSLLKDERNKVDEAYLRDNMDKAIQYNHLLSTQTLKFSNDTMSIRECEDVNCETYFFNEHFEFQNKLEKHFNKVKELKLRILSFMSGFRF